MIKLTKPYFDEEEIKAVRDTLASGWVAGQGPKGKELEAYLKGYLRVRNVIPVNNCTAGLHLALLAIGIGEGDEVIVSDYTFPATGHAVLYCGGQPRFCDVKLDTYNINPNLIEAKINENTKAIIVVHEFGLMADMEPIREIADKYGLKIIEDAACALGAQYKGEMAGSFGDIATFSFHARKNLTCGEGGAVVTNNSKYAAYIRSLSSFGMKSALAREGEFSIPSFNIMGYNYKLSDINSAVVLEQLKKYPRILKKKRELAALYNQLLKNSDYLTLPKEEKDYFHVYQTYVVTVDSSIDRNKLIVALREDGVQSTIGTYASHSQEVYQSEDECPNSLFLFKHSLALPLYYTLQESEVEEVTDKLQENIRKLKG